MEGSVFMTGTQIEELNLCEHSGLSFCSQSHLSLIENTKRVWGSCSPWFYQVKIIEQVEKGTRWENSPLPREDPAGSVWWSQIPSIGGGRELGGMGVTAICVSVTAFNHPVQPSALWDDPPVRRPLLRPPLINVTVVIEHRVWIQMLWVQVLVLPFTNTAVWSRWLDFSVP